MTMLLFHVEIQLTLEDSGSPRATSLGYSINDETCEVAVRCFIYFIPSVLSCLYIDYKMPQNLSRCLYIVPSARFLPPPGRSQSGASVSSPSLTSDLIQIFFSIDHVQGCTTTSSERMGNRCTLVIGTLFSTTTPAFPPGFGTTGRTTEVWRSAFLQRRLSF